MYMNKVEITGVNTAKLKTLKESEKSELIARAKNGDERAREELVNGNLRLVLSVVQKFTSRGENPDDLFQVGCIGLIKAIDNFNPQFDVKFSTYAVPMIIGEIRRYLRDNNSLRVSRSMRDIAYKAMQSRERLTAQLLREPTPAEIAEDIDISEYAVVQALESIVEPVSLYEPVYSDGGDTIYVMDQVGDALTDRDWVDELTIRESIQALSDREKRILSLRFLAGRTQTEVAGEIGISQAQISRLEKNAIAKIKDGI
ncbi:MAG: RNA polymerase sporulation sigma factor SigG [Clostridiales bacterium]|nr:RNA polymerase sporulation sigma factor SigG [Clostridiales bacterium]